MPDERHFTTCISNSKLRAALIEKAASRIFFCAPGISAEEIAAIKIAQKNPKVKSIQLTLDVSQNSFQHGYWGDLTPAQFSESGVRFQQTGVLTGLRLGILVVDEHAWIYTPTPQSIEDEFQSVQTNCLSLSRNATALLVDSLTASNAAGGSTFPILEKALLEKIQQEITDSAAPVPSQKRLLEILRPRLKIIQFEIRGYKITQQTIRLPREVIDIIGSSERTINDRINADWKVFASTSEAEFEIFQQDLEKAIEEIKSRHLVRLGQYGFGLVQSEFAAFQQAWKNIQADKLEKFREVVRQRVASRVEQSQKMLYQLLEERFKSGKLIIPSQKSLFPVTEQERVARHLKSIIDHINWPTAEVVLKNLVVKYRSYDLSEQLLQDIEFLKLLESHFGGLDMWLQQMDTQPTKVVTDVHGFFLN